MTPLVPCLQDNLNNIKQLCGDCGELHFNRFDCRGTAVCFLCAEGMTDNEQYADICQSVVHGCRRLWDSGAQAVAEEIELRLLCVQESCELTDVETLVHKLYSGHMAILIDGDAVGRGASITGFKTRSISQPIDEVNILGGKEGFIESLRVNQTILRRRLKSPALRMETIQIGAVSKTSCALVYLEGTAPQNLIDRVREKLQNARVDMVTDDGAVRLLLNEKTWSPFSEIAHTERPDTLAARLYEGRLGVLIDGTPFALILPSVFTDNFSELDDYGFKTLFSNLIRVIRYAAFLIGALLPGLYVAIVTLHPELMPRTLLLTIVVAQESLPFPLVLEMIFLLIIYEIMREAGLRLPRQIGHAVSLVGALVIGETAAAAGIIGTPTILVAAVAIISTYVVPSLSEACVVLRFAFVLIGGIFGLLGVTLGLGVFCLMICRTTQFGAPLSAGLSPTSPRAFFTMLLKSKRQSYASPDAPKIDEVPGAEQIGPRPPKP